MPVAKLVSSCLCVHYNKCFLNTLLGDLSLIYLYACMVFRALFLIYVNTYLYHCCR
jgi:hypothetical protein